MTDTPALPSSLPSVPLADPTREALEAAVAAMDDVQVPTAVADLIADAEEMASAADDITDLVARKYKVSAGLVRWIAMLVEELRKVSADREITVVEATPEQTQEMDKSRARLLKIRSELADLAEAAGLPATVFALQTKRSNRLNVVLMRVGQVLRNARKVLDQLPDHHDAEELIAEGEGIIAAAYNLRTTIGLGRAGRTGETQRQERIERLLLDALVYLSRMGRAAYRRQPARRQKYLLDHIYGAKASKVGDPGAGGTIGGAEHPDDEEGGDEDPNA